MTIFQGIVDFQPINMAELQAKHMSYVVKQYGPLEGIVDSYYRLSNDALLQVSHLVNGSMSQSMLSNGKMASKMVLHQSVSINNNHRSIAHKFWIQLGILNNIKETIVAYKETGDSSGLTFHSFISRLVQLPMLKLIQILILILILWSLVKFPVISVR